MSEYKQDDLLKEAEQSGIILSYDNDQSFDDALTEPTKPVSTLKKQAQVSSSKKHIEPKTVTKANIKPQKTTSETQERQPIKATNENTNEPIITARLKMVDDTKQTSRIKTVSGVQGSDMIHKMQMLVNGWIDSGYEQANELPTEIKNNETLTLHFKHVQKSVSRTKTVRETIEFSMSDNQPAPKTIVQTLDFKQVGNKDLVTGNTKWNDDGLTKVFKPVDIPQIPGYTPDTPETKQIPAIKVTVNTNDFHSDQDISRIVNYLADCQTIQINCIDQETDNTVIKSISLSGFTNQSVNFNFDLYNNGLIKKGYDLVNNPIPYDLIYTANGQKKYQITYKHHYQILDINHSINPKNDEDLKPELVKFITRTVKRHLTGHNLKSLVQTARFIREAKLDMVTGKITYGPYSKPVTMPAINIKSLPGYKAEPNYIKETEVSYTSAPITEDVYFKPQKQNITITFLDTETNAAIREDRILTGHTDEHVTYDPTNDISTLREKHYELIDNPLDSNLIFKPDEQIYTLTFKHEKAHLTASHDLNPKTGERQDGLVNIVTRRIEFETPKTITPPNPVVQSAHFERNAVVDLVTGDVQFGAWSKPQELKAYTVPKLVGYQPSLESIEAEEVTGDAKNSHVKISYEPTTQTITFIFRDQDDVNILASEPFAGKTGHKLDFNLKELVSAIETQGYHVMPYKFNLTTYPAKDTSVTINFKHNIRHLTVDHHDTSQLNLSEPLKLSVNYRFVLSFVNKHDEDLQKPFILTQHLKREAWYDEALKKIKYGEYQKENNFPKSLTLKPIKGLVPTKDKIELPDLSILQHDAYATVVYLAPKQVIKIDFATTDNERVQSFNLDFDLGGNKEVTLDTLLEKVRTHGYELDDTAPLNNNLPKSFAYNKAQADQRHVRVIVKEIFDSKIETNKIKRTIIVTNPDKSKREIDQIAILTRIVKTGRATKRIIKYNWSTNLWDAYVPTNIPGFTPNIKGIGESIVDGETKSQVITINYIKIPDSVVINAKNKLESQSTESTESTDQESIEKPKKLNWFQQWFQHLFHHDESTENKHLALEAPKEHHTQQSNEKITDNPEVGRVKIKPRK